MRLVDPKCRMIMKQPNNFNVEIVSKSYLATVKWLSQKRSDNRLTLWRPQPRKAGTCAIWFLKISLLVGVFLTHGASTRNVESAYACWKIYRTNDSISCTGQVFSNNVCWRRVDSVSIRTLTVFACSVLPQVLTAQFHTYGFDNYLFLSYWISYFHIE